MSTLTRHADGLDRLDGAVALTALLVLIDGLMTLPYWKYETNPVVIGLGPAGMMLVKLTAVGVLLGLWFRWPGVSDSRVSRVAVSALCALYVLVTVSNVAYVVTAG